MNINKNKKQEIIIILLCLCILLPLFIVSFYNRPASDDYSYSLLTGIAAQNGGSIFDILKAAWDTNMQYYNTWQGLYSSAFILALQPGIFGEKLYVFSFFIVVLSTYLPLLGAVHILNRHYFKKSVLFSVYFSLMLYTLLVVWMPDINDGMYWFNGAMNYTPWAFTNIFNLCLLLEIGKTDSKRRHTVFIILSALLAFLTSGGNHVTAFANIMLLFIACIVAFSKKKFFPLIPFAAACIGFIIMFSAPGTSVRQGLFESPGAVTTVIKTALHVHNLAGEWMSLRWILSLVAITPAAMEFGCTNKRLFSDRFPLYLIICSLAAVAVICGMFCVPYYAMADFGRGRVTNVIWITFNFLSWFIYFISVAYLVAKEYINYSRIISAKYFSALKLLTVSAALCLSVLIFENSLACWPVKAASEFVNGIPQGYAQQMDQRIALYKDDHLESVAVAPITYSSDLLRADHLGSDPDLWPNNVISAYYGKEIVLSE